MAGKPVRRTIVKLFVMAAAALMVVGVAGGPAFAANGDRSGANTGVDVTNLITSNDANKANPPDRPSAEDVATATEKNRVAINLDWLMLGGILVLFMQAGFALVETGFTRAKNAAHTMMMNMVIFALGVVGWFVCGYALMFGATDQHGLLGLTALGSPIHLGSSPHWSDLVFALTVAVVAFTSLESAAGLAGEVRVSGAALKRLVGTGTTIVFVLYTGIALVAVTALPVRGGHTELATRYMNAPMVGIVAQMRPHGLAEALRYVVGGLGALTLVAAANSAMLGLSRLAYSLSTNRQIPSGLGRLHPQRSTPYVLILLAGAIAAGLVVPEDLDFLVGIYTFGAMLAFTIAHVSVCRLRYREPDRDRPFRVPLSVRVRGRPLPVPAVLGALASAAGWVAVMVVHEPARYVGLGWMMAGLALYVIYRRADETSLLRRVTVAPEVLRAEPPQERDYASVLVPLFGTALDEDIVHTAALLVSGEPTDEAAIDAATIEAVWIFVIPMSLPLDARLPEAQIKAARQALARAKAVGEEYAGVQVATATVRTRRAGYAIVDEARRRGVEAIVLGAEEPSAIRGGARLGGRGTRLENFVGDVTKYVISKANCRVIVTAPAAGEIAAERRAAAAAAGR